MLGIIFKLSVSHSKEFEWLTIVVVEGVPAYASPALNENYNNFPPTISFVGGLEPFKDEVQQYVSNIRKENIPTKFEVFPRAYHGLEAIVPNAGISQKAQRFLLESYMEYYDEFILGLNLNKNDI